MRADCTPPAQELIAPESWRTVDIMSDLHLQEGLAHVQTWADYLASSSADALLILGDLFEVWVGDDAADACGGADAHFERQSLQLLQQASRRYPIWVMHGNRDFLLGDQAARLGGFDLMADPCVLSFGGKRWLLTHGDALCLEDTAYQSFRQRVRSPQWQHDFLALPLSERKQQARQMRAQSRLHQAQLQQQQAGSAGLSDVSTPVALQWMTDLSTPVMIHGHTHQPADHAMSPNHQRMVLSDWDGEAKPPRAEVIRLQRQKVAPFDVQASRVRCAPAA